MLRWLSLVVLLALVAAAALFIIAGRGAPPSIVITHPDKLIGQASRLEVTVGAPGARLDELSVTLEQNGKRFPLFALDAASPATEGAPSSSPITQPDADHLRISRPIGQQEHSGTAVRRRPPGGDGQPLVLSVAADAVGDDVARPAGPPRAAAAGGRVDASLRQSWRRRNGRLPRHPGRRDFRRPGRRCRVSRLPGERRRNDRRRRTRPRWRSSRCSPIRI